MGSSSRRKHSKKKSSKLSSKARNMKKSRRTKSKKHGRRHDSSTDNSMSSHSISSPSDSYSSNTDDDSKSVSTSSSKGTHRRRSNVSRSLRNLVKKKKQTRRKSSSKEDSRDLSRARKRKRSKKNGDSKSRKNSQRKKLRRDVASSDSHSCSTCNDSNSDSERSEGERVRRRYRENKKDTGDRRKGKLGSPLRACRSPSNPSYSGYQDENHSISQGKETFMGGKNSRRLRSVIIFAEKPEPSIREENESGKDMQNDELVYDHDDYPSKSSSGEGSKKVSTRPPNASDGGQQVENVGFISDHGVTELTESRIDVYEQDRIHNPSSDEFETNSYIKESTSNIPLQDSGSSGNDLEAVLKQKALENLKKFRGALKTDVKPTACQKDGDNGDHNGSSSSKTEIVQSKFPKQAGFTVVEREISDGGFTRKVLGTAKQSPSDPHDGAHSGNPNEESPPVLGKSEMGTSSIRGTSSGVDPTLKQIEPLTVSADKSHLETETSLRNADPKTAQSKSSSLSTNQGTACSSALVESTAAEKQSLNNQPDEAKDGSQYQQKTMSVMRGGEMVQVNYKVYIPKKAPALARRQLQR